MKRNIAPWVLGIALVGYSILCLILIFVLVANPLGGSIDSDELTSNTLLPDFSAIDQAPERKQLFIETLRPLVEQKNYLLQTSRDQLLEIKQSYSKNGYLDKTDSEQLKRLRRLRC